MKQAILFCILFLTAAIHAQQMPDPLTPEERQEVVDSIGNILERTYVFPEVGLQIQSLLQEKHKSGAYDAITDPQAFADVLTTDIRSLNNDLHMRVRFDPELIAEQRNAVTPEDSLAIEQRYQQEAQRDNYGFKELKILDGNIGYVNLTGFYYVTEEAGYTAQAAMNFLSNSDAIIIDLRQNGGGSPAMIQLISSYLFGPEPVHLNNFFYRPQDDITQTWTLPYVPGKRRPDVDVFVLTSKRTFSAAEEFSYNLRNLERATLIGEVTGGGAHPGGTQIATNRYTVWVPTGRAINPISKTNWEGTGVKPHVEVPAEKALDIAQLKALNQLAENTEGQEKFQYEWVIQELEASQDPIQVSEETLKAYAGNYGPRMLVFEDGNLYYQREGNPKHKLIPMTEDIFMIPEIPYFRLQMLVDEDGQVEGLKGLYQNGQTDQHKRTEEKP